MSYFNKNVKLRYVFYAFACKYHLFYVYLPLKKVL